MAGLLANVLSVEVDSRARLLSDDCVIVRGGSGPVPETGTAFSGAYGRTLEEAAAAVPHGTIRGTTVGAIVKSGGSVTHKPELKRSGTLNEQQVDIVEGSIPSSFSVPFENPVPKDLRVS